MASTKQKVAIGCGVVLVIMVIGVVAAGFFISRAFSGLREQGQVVMADAQAYGRGRGSSECIEEGFRRLAECDGIVCQGTNQAWLQSCLDVSNRDPALCDGVPREEEIRASVDWRIRVCRERNAADPQSCAQLMGSVQRVCHPRVPR